MRCATLVEADREVRVLDKLEERQRAQHQVAAVRAETKLLDGGVGPLGGK